MVSMTNLLFIALGLAAFLVAGVAVGAIALMRARMAEGAEDRAVERMITRRQTLEHAGRRTLGQDRAPKGAARRRNAPLRRPEHAA